MFDVYDLRVGSLRRDDNGKPVLTLLMDSQAINEFGADIWMNQMANRHSRVTALIFIGARVTTWEGHTSWVERRVYNQGVLVWRNGKAV